MKQIPRLAIQTLSSTLVGAPCAGAVGFAVFQMLNSDGQAGCAALFAAFAAGLAATLVYPIGAAAGAYSAGRLLKQKGSFWFALLGTATSALFFFFSVVVFPYHEIIDLVLFAALAPTFALLGFYLRDGFKDLIL